MLKLRSVASFLYLIPTLLTYVGCSDNDDNGAGAGGGSAEVGGATGSAGRRAVAGAGHTDNDAGDGGRLGGGDEGGLDDVGGSSGAAPMVGSGGAGVSGGGSGPGGSGGAGGTSGASGSGKGGGGGVGGAALVGDLTSDIQTVVVIYAENRSFDGLFGNFPGAHGLSDVVNADGSSKSAYIPQKDRDNATVLTKLPRTWNGVTQPGNATTVTQAQSDGLANRPFSVETAFMVNDAPPLTTNDVTRDLAHRFFENVMEINGGTNDQFAAFLDAGGLTMGHFDYSQSGLYKLAQQYVLADNFFEGAYGGSFLNHQYLICACAPTVPASYITSNAPSVNVLGAPNAKGVPQLATNTSSPASALDGPPSFKTGNIAPLDYFGVGDGYRAVNTMQPAYQPSGNQPAAAALDPRYANPATNTTLPPQTQVTVGDLLTAKNVNWAWYATSWDAATADGVQANGVARTVIYSPSGPRAAPDFQPHHHPFNFYAAFDPATHAADRTAHLRDYNALLSDIQKGTLPPVVYYKPTGNVNQHPGYANADDGDSHITALVNKLKAGAQWSHMMIVITYDEYGGQWDHVAPPKGDLIGPGTRIPAIIVSPYAKAGTVDHTQYDTASTLRLITRRFAIDTLPGLTARDQALITNGGSKMGDLTAALNL